MSVEYSGRRFTMFQEKEMSWTKFKDFTRFKKRAFAPEMEVVGEAETAKKEQKKML